MIVETMTDEELKAELLLDAQSLFNFVGSKINKYSRLVLKAKKFPVQVFIDYTSPRKNKWLIFFNSACKRERGNQSIVVMVCYRSTDKGLFAVRMRSIKDKQSPIIYPPHFFKRFAERLEIENLFGIDLLKRYFEKNDTFLIDRPISDNYENEGEYSIALTSEEGVGIGIEKPNNAVILKTFVTYDMLKGEQIEKYTNLEKEREELINRILSKKGRHNNIGTFSPNTHF